LIEPAADPQALLLQLLDPSNRADPYPAYDRIREHGPLQLPEMTLNVFSSYQDCDDVLRHPSSASDRLKSTRAQREIAEGVEARPLLERHLGQHPCGRGSDQRGRGLRRLPDNVVQESSEIGCRVDAFEAQIDHDVVGVVWAETLRSAGHRPARVPAQTG
jgi:hypothetical protein